MRKKIGIVAWKTGDNSIGITAPYYDFFSQFGAVQMISPSQDVLIDLDLLVLPGGSDINPVRYGQEPEIFTSNPDVCKEHFDVVKLPGYISNKIPVFGICRGMQAINLFFGGTLNQAANHAFYSVESRGEKVHSVEIFDAAGIKCGPSFKVNSMHHQSIDKLGHGLVVLAKCKEDKTIEAIKHNELKIIGLQWHPEEYYCPFAAQIIKTILNPE